MRLALFRQADSERIAQAAATEKELAEKEVNAQKEETARTFRQLREAWDENEELKAENKRLKGALDLLITLNGKIVSSVTV